MYTMVLIILPGDRDRDEDQGDGMRMGITAAGTVSYTHLTLPTIYSV